MKGNNTEDKFTLLIINNRNSAYQNAYAECRSWKFGFYPQRNKSFLKWVQQRN